MSAAAKLLQTDPDLKIIILESTHRIGGRVRSAQMGAPGREVLVEAGANWIINDGNAIWDMAQEFGLKHMDTHYLNYVVYDEHGSPVDPQLVQSRLNVIGEVFQKAGKDAQDAQVGTILKEDKLPKDEGVLRMLQAHGWNLTYDDSPVDNLDYMLQWKFVDYEYQMPDVSRNFFSPESVPIQVELKQQKQSRWKSKVIPNSLVLDPRGYESLLQDFQAKHVPSDHIRLNQRVQTINYDITYKTFEKSYGAVVTVQNETDSRLYDFMARRVISTVSAGVLNHELIDFAPPLAYSPAKYNPFQVAQYTKIFYQFDRVFWDTDVEFIDIVRPLKQHGHCNNWQNMEHYLPGSGIIRCELMHASFEELKDPTTNELTPETLDYLLGPLRLVYGAEVVGTPIDVYYNALQLDKDYGYGAYGYWQIGRTFRDFASFFGGVEVLHSRCERHNGCNRNGEWILHISGSASCFMESEFVHGGYMAGERSARFVLDTLGYPNMNPTHNDCDLVFFDSFLFDWFKPVVKWFLFLVSNRAN